MATELIVALDFENQNEALKLIDMLDPTQCALKVGNEMFTLFGPDFVKLLINKHYRVFLDLKFHDIPNTVAKACKASAELGVWMINVHAMGGIKMMKAAKEALADYGTNRPFLIAVTLLTSMKEEELSPLGINAPIEKHVLNLASQASEAGLDGVVCSAFEVNPIKRQCGTQFVTVTPGIRLSDNPKNDQSRVMTPQDAVNQGSDYLVIGRPITQAVNPTEVVARILSDIT